MQVPAATRFPYSLGVVIGSISNYLTKKAMKLALSRELTESMQINTEIARYWMLGSTTCFIRKMAEEPHPLARRYSRLMPIMDTVKLSC